MLQCLSSDHVSTAVVKDMHQILPYYRTTPLYVMASLQCNQFTMQTAQSVFKTIRDFEDYK